MHSLLEGLNTEQQRAVEATEGPLLILAGAGSGKTKTLTHRIAHIIAGHKATPYNILAVTFTNKAAREMRERVADLLAENADNRGFMPYMGTFHGICVRILRRDAEHIGLAPNFVIFDESDRLAAIKRATKQLMIDEKACPARTLSGLISSAKNELITPEQYRSTANGPIQKAAADVYPLYQKTLQDNAALDFDDLIGQTVRLLETNDVVRARWQEQFRYIMIDEYQDINSVQYELTKLLVGENQNICAVGDTDQNIYSWRGANIKNMLHFEKDFPNAKVIMLEQNYRSTKNIIEAANNVIKKNQYRVDKTLFTENVDGESIDIYEAYDEVVEAESVAEKIDDLLKGNIDPEEVAVLYRANFQSRVLEEALLGRQIPYQVLGIKFFERREVKDILSYIKAAYNKESLSDIKRIINTPTRGIGKVTLTKLFAGNFSDLPKTMQEKINMFYILLDKIREYTDIHTPSESIKYVIKESGLEDELSRGPSDDLERLENMRELVTLATKYDQMERGLGIEKLLEDASLASDQDTLMHKSKGVRLMTVHASKGLEFKYVFITGLEQDLFPHTRMDGKSKEDSEEERRLFYVALTRARQKLYLSYASLRTIFGNRQVNTPSEFIYDIPEHLTSFDQGGPKNGERVVYL